MEKKIRALAEKLRALKHLSGDERILFAWSLLATPDQRWQRARGYLRSVLSSRPSPARKSVSKS